MLLSLVLQLEWVDVYKQHYGAWEDSGRAWVQNQKGKPYIYVYKTLWGFRQKSAFLNLSLSLWYCLNA